MNILQVIRKLAADGDYEVTSHCLLEMDKDSISLEQIEDIILYGKIAKRNPRQDRYTFKWKTIMCCIEILRNGNDFYMTIITAGRERR